MRSPLPRLALLALTVLACQLGRPLPTPTPPATATTLRLPTVGLPTAIPPTATATVTPLAVATRPPTATAPANGGTLSGWVWHDLCDPGPVGDPPPDSAPPGCVAAPTGGYRANGEREATEPAIGGVVVRLGAGACPAVGLAESATASTGPSYTFSGLSAGTYCVSIDPFSAANQAKLLPGQWTSPGLAEGLLGQTVSLAPGQAQTDISFGWDYQFLPSGPNPTPAATVVGPGACTYAATLLEDVTVPPNTVFTPGVAFVKTWRVRNDGSCTWGRPEDALRSLAFVGGTRLGAPETVPLPAGIAPGFTADLSINFTAPAAPGTYLSEWKLRAEPNTLVGVGPGGAAPLAVQIVVTSTTTLLRPGAVFHAPRVGAAPGIDGSLGDWSGLPLAISAVAYRPENWTGAADHSAAFALAWDSNNLYLAARVLDDVHVQTQTGNTLFRGDSLELLLDTDLSGDFDATSLDGDDYQLGLSPGANRAAPEAYLWFPAARTGSPNGISMAARADSPGPGYVIEAAIPWAVLGLAPAPNSHYGFVLSASDNDTPGVAEQQSMISTEAGRRLTNPTTWGTLILDP